MKCSLWVAVEVVVADSWAAAVALVVCAAILVLPSRQEPRTR